MELDRPLSMSVFFFFFAAVLSSMLTQISFAEVARQAQGDVGELRCDLASLSYPFKAGAMFYMTNWVLAKVGSSVRI